MVVDDEALIVQRLRLLFAGIERQHRQFRLVATARNGAEALELAADLKPDIVITDIVMPGMDGLELTGRLKELLPRAILVILSAYTDFDYARRALEMNVQQYLLKVPLSETEVAAALLRAQQTLEARESEAVKLRQLNATVRGNLHGLRKQVVEELLHGEVGPGGMEARCGELMIRFKPQKYSCFAVRIENLGDFRRQYESKDRKALKYGMLNIIEELLGASERGFCCELEPELIAGFVSRAELNSELDLLQANQSLGQSIRDHIHGYLKLTVTVSFSGWHSGWGTAPQAFQEAKQALEDTFYIGEGRVITPSSRLLYETAAADEFAAALRQLQGLLAPGADGQARQRAVQRIRRLLQSRKLQPGRVLEETERFIRAADPGNGQGRQEAGQPGGQKVEQTVEQTGGQMPGHNDPPRFASCHGLLDWLENGLPGWLERLHQTEERTEIRKAKQFIDGRLAERLTLHQVAEHVNMNPAYFSAFFKKETGEGFIDYLNRRRIDSAKLLMEQRDYTNAELAEAAGIADERYFCTLFRKHTGISPQRFMRNLRKRPLG
jgi:two-component system response regulator YesN